MAKLDPPKKSIRIEIGSQDPMRYSRITYGLSKPIPGLEIHAYELCLSHVRADRSLRSVISKIVSAYDITMMEWLALAAVYSRQNSVMSMTQAAINLDVTLPQVTALVSTLIDQKFVKQKIQSKDHRSRSLEITLKGRRTFIKIDRAVGQALREWSVGIEPDKMTGYIDVVKVLAK